MSPSLHLHSHTGRSADDLSELLHLVYGAASNSELWPSVLQAVAASLHGRSGVLFTPYLPPQDKGMYHGTQHHIRAEHAVGHQVPGAGLVD